jgi:ankyrin repeat protein
VDTSADARGAYAPSKSHLATPIFTDDHEKIRLSLSKKNKQILMESLRFAQINARHTTIKTAHAKTCTWILENRQYHDWMNIEKLDKHRGFLWIKGKAGTGKSTLMKFFWGDARKRMKNHLVLSFFFNARGEELEKSTLGVYRSLLIQLLECRPSLRSVFDSLGLSKSDISLDYPWTVESLEALLLQAIRGLGTLPVVCFIDALDECEEELVRDMVQFLEQISDVAISEGIRFQVCFSSRHYPHITISHGLELVLEGQEGHTQDIANYIKTELKAGNSIIADKIRAKLQKKASGIFMWVVLVVRMLNRESDRGQVQELWKKLQDIPNDLHQLFGDILTRDSLNQDRLLLCIQWILLAKDPLSPEQMHQAILSGVDPVAMAEMHRGDVTKDTIRLFVLDSSKGLAEITVSEKPTVQFIHESVRDFFLKKNGLDKIWPDCVSNFQGQGHDRLKLCCLNYMNMVAASPWKHRYYTPIDIPSKAEEIRKPLKKLMLSTQIAPFLVYSTLNIFHHAELAEGSGISQANFLKLFSLRQWVELRNLCTKKYENVYTESVSLLYVLAEFNLPNLMTASGSIGQCLDVGNEPYGCPLLVAVANHSESALRLCLDSIEVRQYRRDTDTAAVAKRLLQFKYGDRFHNRLDVFHSKKGEFLLCAAKLDHEELFELLVKSRNTEVDFKDLDRRTALWCASLRGWSKSVRLLLDASSAMINMKDVHGEAPLHAAAKEGAKVVTELLIERGANVNAQGGHYGNALQAASAGGHFEITALLLDNGASINTQGGHYGNALQAASAGGHCQIAALLLNNGASINMQGGHYNDALHAASAGGHHKTAALLLGNGAIANAQGGQYGNALQAASAGGHYQTVTLLLDNGANINAQGGQHGNAIQAALNNYFAEVTELLLERGAIETPQWSHHYLLRHIRKQIPPSTNSAPQPPQTSTLPLQTPTNALPPPTEQPL